MKAFVAGIGLLAPGLADWTAARRVLAGRSPYVEAPLRVPTVRGLAPNEARRCPLIARVALDVGQQALGDAGWAPSLIPTVFSSASGDLDIADRNCQSLAADPPTISPTLFHNSVHNAVAGYWGIAMQAQAPTTSLSAYDDSFAAGLLEALTWLATHPRVLLVVYDLPSPRALAAARPVTVPIAVAMALAVVRPAAAVGALDGRWVAGPAIAAPLDDGRLERLRNGNAAGRGLPLLVALARQTATTMTLPFWQTGALKVEVQP
ncbi:MAG: beta-ketoacyl synthase chain length factor [Acidiferrobacter sp.]